MTNDDTLANRVMAALHRRRRVEEKGMFGGLTLMVRGKMCVSAEQRHTIREGGKLMKSLRLLVAVAVFAVVGLAQQPNPSVQPGGSGAAFDRLKLLAGEWEGKSNEGGQEIPTTTTFRVVSDGSALMNIIAQGTPHEMVTMFHMDGDDLLATHYCAAHNQPRFRFVATSDPNVVDFEFKDATNLSSPTTGHMVGVKFTLLDPNHHVEEWTFLANGQTSTHRFDFRRKQ